jgi:hypothetical protein
VTVTCDVPHDIERARADLSRDLQEYRTIALHVRSRSD